MKKRRLPAPWTAEKVEGGYRVKDDHGHWLAFVYAKEDLQVPKMPNYLTWDEARRVAKAITRLPEAQRTGHPEADLTNGQGHHGPFLGRGGRPGGPEEDRGGQHTSCRTMF
jgi:hypothetical protein